MCTDILVLLPKIQKRFLVHVICNLKSSWIQFCLLELVKELVKHNSTEWNIVDDI